MSITNLLYKNIHFDSDEEVFMAMWLDELKKHGFVKRWKKETKSIPLTEGLKIKYDKYTKLKTKYKVEEKEHILLRPSEYTPDFKVEFTLEAFSKEIVWEITNYIDNPRIKNAYLWVDDFDGYLEVKPSFDQNNMERLFKNNQKFIWDKHEIFVNLVEPIELFKKTFVPSEALPYLIYRRNPTGKNKGKKKTGDFKYDWTPKTIHEFLQTPNE